MAAVTGTWTLIRLSLRRDRLRLPVWILGIVGFFSLVAASFPNIYPSEQERQARATLMENPTALAFRGPGYGFEDYTYGAMLAHELVGYAAIAAALMSIFLIVRHTRTEEETGRQELVRSSIVGRYAAPVSALSVVIGANLAIALLFALVLPVLPGDYSPAGSLAFGLGIGATGIVFAGVASLTSQLTADGRGASSMAILCLGATYLLRAIGDVQENALVWLSPIGWAQATRAFVDERWWPLLLPTGAMVLVLGLIGMLINRRDLGAGLLPQRPGPDRASSLTTTPFGFAFRQLRGGIIGWSIGLAVLGVAFGSLIGDVGTFIDDNPQLEDFLTTGANGSMVDAFLGLVILVMAFMATGFAVSAVTRARAEESEGRAESLLSTALARPRWLGSYLLVSMLGSGIILLTGAAVLGVTAAVDQGDGGILVRTLWAGLAHMPAIWLVAGLGVTTFGLLPRLLVLPWLMLIYGIFAGLFGDMVQLPSWALNLSPYEHIPNLPGGEVAAIPLVALCLVAAGLFVSGLMGFWRRDLEMA
jgi:ABC-2 type transport system permease protein